jgi:transcription antitermination factor NusG
VRTTAGNRRGLAAEGTRCSTPFPKQRQQLEVLWKSEQERDPDSMSGAMSKNAIPQKDDLTGQIAQLEPAAKAWFVVQTRYRFEKRVAEHLANKGIEVFLPLRKENRDWSDRKAVVTVPLFPGYAFVYTDWTVVPRLLVLQTAGVMGFVSFARAAAIVPRKQIEDLKLLLAEAVPFSLYPFVKVGQRVRIRGGCLDGVEGLLTQREKEKLVISIDSIRRSLAIEIRGYELEYI